jgi:hypothetical protein
MFLLTIEVRLVRLSSHVFTFEVRVVRFSRHVFFSHDLKAVTVIEYKGKEEFLDRKALA